MNIKTDLKSTEYRRHAACGINRDVLKQLIAADCKTYTGEDRNIFIGSDRFMARQFIDSVAKNIHQTSYCVINGNYCKIPCHILGYDKFHRPIKSLPMVYTGEIMLLLASNSKLEVEVYDGNDNQISKFIYRRKGAMWNLVHTYDYNSARVINSVVTIKPDCRKRVAAELGVPADPMFHTLFDECMEELKRRE